METKITMYFTRGFAFGYSNPVWLNIYIGWLVVHVDNYYNRKPVDMYKCNYKHIWVLKHKGI